MKNLCLFLFFSFIFFNTACSQNWKYELPEGQVLTETHDSRGNSLYADTFYPIGWSKDGKFAYLCQICADGSGCYPSLIVLDLVSDRRVVNWGTEARRIPDCKDVGELWEKNKKIISQMLRKQGIVQQVFSDFAAGGQFQVDGEEYRVEVQHETGHVSDVIMDGTQSLIVKVRKEGVGGKTVYAYTYDKNKKKAKDVGPAYIRSVEVAGSLKSPFEDRALLILDRRMRGFENTTDSEYFLIGCHLRVGFR